MSNKARVPTYRRHKQSGQAIVTLPDGLGGRHDVLLGSYGTAASRAEYARVIAEWEANGRRLPPQSTCKDLSVNELVVAFWPHINQHYRHADGSPTSEVNEFRYSLRPLKHFYGHTPANSFGPLALKAIRQNMAQGWEHPKHGQQKPLSRGVINQRIGRIRRLFKWAVENELIQPSVLHALQAVRGLQRGRTAARETEPVSPVSPVVVEDTVPFLNRQLAAMVRVQLLTGARPGEVCILRACDIDMSGKVWLYRPGSHRGQTGEHKTAHHGHQRIIAIGPKAQEVITPFLSLDTRVYLFSPWDAREERYAAMRKGRQTKVQPSQTSRRKARPRRGPGRRYTVSSYGHAIAKACDSAFPPPEPLARRKDETHHKWRERLTPEQQEELRRWQREHRWHPHQLRHTRATELRREFGLDAARVVLGHRSPQITEVYAEIDVSKAAEVMERLG
jgi:integrase